MAFPDFIGIGAQKAGSTWLHNGLSSHPRIWTPPKKEIHYFDRRPDWLDPKIDMMRKQQRGRSRLETWRWYRKYSRLPRDDRWYASLFRPGWGQIAGEVTPDYSALDEEAVSRVHRVIPGARVLFFMRNPIERTWSHAVMDLRRKGKDVRKMTASELHEFFDRGYVSRRADYPRILENWRGFYPDVRIFAGFLEDAHFYPFKLLRRVYRFLNVDPDFKPPGMRGKVNSRSLDYMPVEAARYLARSYRDGLERLRDWFGGYASFWAYCADRLLGDSFEPGYMVPYPMWDSSMWEDWTRDSGDSSAARFVRAKPQSRPLSRF